MVMNAAARGREPRQISQPGGRIEHIVEGAAIDDEVEAVLQFQRQRRVAEIKDNVRVLVIALIQTMIFGIGEKRVERAVADEAAVSRSSRRRIDFQAEGIHVESRSELGLHDRYRLARCQVYALTPNRQKLAGNRPKPMLPQEETRDLVGDAHVMCLQRVARPPSYSGGI